MGLTAQIDKVKKTTQKNKNKKVYDSGSNSDSEHIEEYDPWKNREKEENVYEQQEIPLTVKEIKNLLQSCSHTHPICELQQKHPESDSHCLQI